MKKALIITGVVLLLLAGLTVLSAWYSATHFTVTRYEIAAPLDQALRLVQLSDLHGNEYGENNCDLLQSIRELQPDMIMLTGDMIDADDDDIQPLLDLIGKLKEIAPVWLCYGNHETSWMTARGEDLRPRLEETGATVLEAEYVDLERGGDRIRIAGYAGYYRDPIMTTKEGKQQDAELQFADDFEATDSYKILLEHVPTTWMDWKYLGTYDVDLILCGHYHGGQIRLPLIGGIYAPYIGWFPRFTKGLYQKNGSSMVLSAGLGTQKNIPRINNPGELVCIDLVPEK